MKFLLFRLRFLRRVHTHVVCHRGDYDYSCLLGEGTCVENVVQRELIKQQANNSTELTTEFLQFTTSCSCEIIQNSIFSSFV